MAINPLTIVKIATTIGQTATDENGRWLILIAVITPLVLVLMILSSPFAIFFGTFSSDNIPIQNIIVDLQLVFREQIKEEQKDPLVDTIELIVLGSEDNTIIDNSVDVLSFFSVLNTIVNGDEVIEFDEEDKKYLTSIYWEMNIITSKITETKSMVIVTDENGEEYEKEVITVHKTIYVNSLLAKEMAANYDFDESELEVLKQVKVDASLIMPSSAKTYLSTKEIQEIQSKLLHGVEIKREVLVAKALSIVGQVNYFWGGKSHFLGNDKRWGKNMEVTSSGSITTGTIRPYGLDCSGYISWVFINAGAPLDAIGNGVSAQWNTSTLIPENEAKEGDLVFLAVPNTIKINHIGIIVGKDEEGNLLVAHANSKYNGITVNTVDEVGFLYIRRSALLIKIGKKEIT